MRNAKRRYAALGVVALVMAALPAVLTASPAHAAANCQYFYGPTPSVEADIDGDGRPDARVPSVSNVSVCAQTDAIVHGQQLRWETCDWFSPGCWRLYIHAQAGVTIDTGLDVCRSLDGVATCTTLNQEPWTFWTPDMPVMCVGFDVEGGSPCSHGWFAGFE